MSALLPSPGPLEYLNCCVNKVWGPSVNLVSSFPHRPLSLHNTFDFLPFAPLVAYYKRIILPITLGMWLDPPPPCSRPGPAACPLRGLLASALVLVTRLVTRLLIRSHHFIKSFKESTWLARATTTRDLLPPALPLRRKSARSFRFHFRCRARSPGNSSAPRSDRNILVNLEIMGIFWPRTTARRNLRCASC